MENQKLKYSIKVSRRAKKLRVAVYCDSTVLVTLPLGFSLERAENFLHEKMDWILRSLEFFKPYKNRAIPHSGRREFKKHRLLARQLAEDKVEQWNKFYGFSFNRIAIKNQKTRWGSCSKKGNLNFNYKIIHLPENVLDYLIVHELCHLKEFNHSKNFWHIVSQAIPNYKNLRKDLRNFNSTPN